MLKITITGDRGEGKSTLANILCDFLQQETNYKIYLESDIKGEVGHIISAFIYKKGMDKRSLCLLVKNTNNGKYKEPKEEYFPPIDKNNLIRWIDEDKKIVYVKGEIFPPTSAEDLGIGETITHS